MLSVGGGIQTSPVLQHCSAAMDYLLLKGVCEKKKEGLETKQSKHLYDLRTVIWADTGGTKEEGIKTWDSLMSEWRC